MSGLGGSLGARISMVQDLRSSFTAPEPLRVSVLPINRKFGGTPGPVNEL
jgi:hypothetical protein